MRQVGEAGGHFPASSTQPFCVTLPPQVSQHRMALDQVEEGQLGCEGRSCFWGRPRGGISGSLTRSSLPQAMEGMESPRSQVSPTLSNDGSLSVCSTQVPDLSSLPPALSPQDSGTGPSREQESSQARPWSSGVGVLLGGCLVWVPDPPAKGRGGARWTR